MPVFMGTQGATSHLLFVMWLTCETHMHRASWDLKWGLKRPKSSNVLILFTGRCYICPIIMTLSSFYTWENQGMENALKHPV